MPDIHVAAVDLGTQSLRASVFDLNGKRLVHRRRPIESPRHGKAQEQDPAVWTSFLEEELGSFLRDPGLEIRAIGVAGTSNGWYIAAYREFVVAYREASALLRSGDRMAVFPEGCFPPALPFEPG